jgi:hypothetical protein
METLPSGITATWSAGPGSTWQYSKGRHCASVLHGLHGEESHKATRAAGGNKRDFAVSFYYIPCLLKYNPDKFIRLFVIVISGHI